MHLGDFFFEGHAGDEVVDTLVDGEIGVEIRRSEGGRGGTLLWASFDGLCESEKREKQKKGEKKRFCGSHRREHCGKGRGGDAR